MAIESNKYVRRVDLMIYFSVPADFLLSTLEKIDQLNKIHKDCRVAEVYGQITIGDILSSGRVINVLPQVDLNKLAHYVDQAKKYGIEFNYVLNPSCFGNQEFSSAGIKQVKMLLQNIWDIGIKNITLASPALIEISIATNLNFDIKASTICEINSPAKASFYKKLGVKRIVVDADITRSFVKLRDICKVFGEGVEIIANNVCRKNCPYKMFHYNHEAHSTSQSMQTIKDYFANRCLYENASDDTSYMKLNWIRPEDLHFYESCGINNFKIQGRQYILTSDMIKTVQSYFERSYDGNLYDLITLFSSHNSNQYFIDNKKLNGFIDKFYEEPDFCHDLCEECNYCFTFDCTDHKKIERINSLVRRTLKEKDGFTRMITNKL